MAPRELVRLPPGDDFALTPKIWLALGLLAYNHQLLTLQPLQVLTPAQVASCNTQAKQDAIRAGLAALISVEQMTPETRNAFVAIAKLLLEPIGLQITVHGWEPTQAGRGRDHAHITVADIGGTDAFRLIESNGTSPNQKKAGHQLRPESQLQSA